MSSWSTADSQLAAAFAGCGFVVITRETEILELHNQVNLRYFIGDHSTVRPGLDREVLMEHWSSGELVKADPMHPFVCAMGAIRNHKALLKMQATGARLRLRSRGPGSGWEYEPGEEAPRLRLSQTVCATKDLPLAAAFGWIGTPVIDLEGASGARRYILPQDGHRGLDALDHADWRTDYLRRRQTVQNPEAFGHDGRPIPLAIELQNPEHPLCLAYNGSYAYARLQVHIRKLRRQIIIKAPSSKRRAVIPENPSDALLDEMGRHFQEG